MFDSEEALQTVEAALDAVLGAPVSLGSARDAARLIRSLESCDRRLRAAQLRVQAKLDASGVYAEEAHASAKVMTRHCAQLSPGAAAGRERGARMAQGWFLRIAARLPYRDFEIEVRTWERLADADGPESENSRNHHDRDVRLAQDPVDLGWQWAGGCGAMQGAQMSEILEHDTSAERLADWEKAWAERGAAAKPDSACPDIVHNIVWDADTIGELARRFGGERPGPLDPTTSVCRTARRCGPRSDRGLRVGLRRQAPPRRGRCRRHRHRPGTSPKIHGWGPPRRAAGRLPLPLAGLRGARDGLRDRPLGRPRPRRRDPPAQRWPLRRPPQPPQTEWVRRVA